MSRLYLWAWAFAGASAATLALAYPALAQSAVTLPEVVVTSKPKPVRRAKPAPTPPAPPAPPVETAPAEMLSASNMAGPAPIKERYQLPQPVESITAERLEQTINLVDSQDAVKYMPSLYAAQAQRRRQPDGPGLARVGAQLQCAHAGLRGRYPAIGADRQQQHVRHPALGHDRARRDQTRRFSVRPVRGGLSRQFDGRRAEFHDAHAGQVRGDRQAVGVVPDILVLQHQGHLSDRPDQRIGGHAGAICRRSSASISRTASASR
jgi:hypothetical protein